MATINNNTSWLLEVEKDIYHTEITIFIEAGDIAKTAEVLSLSYKDSHVTISNLGRVRRVYCNGKILREFPDITHFYSGVSEETQRNWVDISAIKDEHNA